MAAARGAPHRDHTQGQRHAQALTDALLHLAKERGIASLGLEGYQTGAWVLLDFNDIIVHVFQEDLRSFYNIEGLWSEGRRVDWRGAQSADQNADRSIHQ